MIQPNPRDFFKFWNDETDGRRPFLRLRFGIWNLRTTSIRHVTQAISEKGISNVGNRDRQFMY